MLGLYEKDSDLDEPRLSRVGEIYDAKVEGKLGDLVKECQLTGELGRHKIFSALDDGFGAVCVVGLGKEGVGFCEIENLELGMENVRVAAGVGSKKLSDHGCNRIFVEPMDYPEQAAEGSALAIWRYQENKHKDSRKDVPKLELYECNEVDAWTRGLFKGDAQNLARTLTDAPANQLTPTAFAQTAVDALCPCGVNVDVRNQEWIESQCLNTFLSVAKGTCEPPIYLEINYAGDDKGDKPVLLTAPGITFNSGGLCLKNRFNMDSFRAAMAGGAAVVAAIRAAAALSLPLNIVGIIPLCENMPSGMAFKPGDVVCSMDGRSVMVHDTAKVGRLVMADILLHSLQTIKPKLIIDVATISGAMDKSLGQAATGVFTNSLNIWQQLKRASAISGDRVWLLPLWNFYSNEIKHYHSVDLSNEGRGSAHACLAAAFLKEFIPCTDWLHFDITATGTVNKTDNFPYLEQGRMSGRPVRTIIQLLNQLACPEEQKKKQPTKQISAV